MTLSASHISTVEMKAVSHDFLPLFYGHPDEAEPQDYSLLLKDKVYTRIFRSSEYSLDQDLQDERKMNAGSWPLPGDVELKAGFAVTRISGTIDLRFCVHDSVFELIADFVLTPRGESGGFVYLSIDSKFIGRKVGVPRVHADDFLTGLRSAWSPKIPTISLCASGFPPAGLPNGLRSGQIIKDHLQ